MTALNLFSTCVMRKLKALTSLSIVTVKWQKKKEIAAFFPHSDYWLENSNLSLQTWKWGMKTWTFKLTEIVKIRVGFDSKLEGDKLYGLRTALLSGQVLKICKSTLIIFSLFLSLWEIKKKENLYVRIAGSLNAVLIFHTHLILPGF